MATRIRLVWLICFASCCLLGCVSTLQARAPEHNYVPQAGYVPDAKTAIRIAVAVWSPIYGEEKVQKEKPFRTTLAKGVWIVKGSLRKDSVGGVAVAEISKQNGQVLRVSHGK